MVRVETPKQAVELLERAVELKGADYVYSNPMDTSSRCLYVHTVNDVQECGCIVGCALALHGWTLDELARCDDMGNVHAIASHFPDQFGEGVVRTLQKAQSVQDGHVLDRNTRGTWGEALEAARHYVTALPDNSDNNDDSDEANEEE